MNRKRIYIFTAIPLLFSLLTQISSCSVEAMTQDLMEDMEERDVKGKDFDEVFCASQLDFAAELLKVTHEDRKNTLLSPLSVMLALSMTANGADGDTLSQMECALGGQIPLEELNKYLYGYIESLASEEGGEIDLSNSIWYRKGFQINRDFLQTNADYYGSDAYLSPFDDSTVKDINAWVKDKTDGRIDEILRHIDEDAAMYLINTLTFDGEWENKYHRDEVYDRIFTAADLSEQKAEMMYSKEKIYLESDDAAGFIKPYQNSNYSFCAILPNEEITLDQYLETLTGEKLQSILESRSYTTVSAALPKFELSFSASLVNPLQEIGIHDAFDQSSADFSKMSDDGKDRLYLSEVMHKTYISVDEAGTKAGAVTMVEAEVKNLVDMKQVVLDRPFLYMILDHKTNLPIFIGTLNSLLS